MKPLKIAVIVGYFPTVSETFIVNQVNSLIDTGHLVSLYSYNINVLQDLHESILKHNLISKVVYFKKPPTSKIMRLLVFKMWVLKHFLTIDWKLLIKTLNFFKYGREAYTLKLFFESQWFLIHNDFDVVHAHFGQNAKRIAYLKVLGILSTKTKLVSTFHGYDLVPNKMEFYRKEYRELLEQSDVLTVNSQYLKDLLLGLNQKLENLYILPVGLDTSFFKREFQKVNTKYFDIVFCGKLIPLKGPDIAVTIVDKLHNMGYKQVRLHIIGDGKMRKVLEVKIKDLGMEKHVFLLGNLTQEAIKAQFENSDVFLLPGRLDPETQRAETQGLVIQEAQAMELPIVVSDVGGMKYGMLPNESGFVIKNGDVDTFAKVIETLILNPDLKAKMGRKGKSFVCKNYDNSILIEKLLVLYNT